MAGTVNRMAGTVGWDCRVDGRDCRAGTVDRMAGTVEWDCRVDGRDRLLKYVELLQLLTES